MKRITHVWVVQAIVVVTMASFASAQNSAPPEQSLGDYARAVRKDKKPTQAKQFDNENMPVDDKLSVVGGAGSSDSQVQSAANGGADAASSDKKGDDKPPAIQPGQSQEDRQKTYDA